MVVPLQLLFNRRSWNQFLSPRRLLGEGASNSKNENDRNQRTHIYPQLTTVKGSQSRMKFANSALALLLGVVLIVGAKAANLPLNPEVTQATIGQTICVPGWTKTVRPPTSYTNRIKKRLIRKLELPPELLVDFELDHRIPLALGGAPSDPQNLLLQEWDEATEKDAVEACLARAVCAGTISLDEARRRIWTDWRAAAKACP
jgi:hypothetical protein